MSDSTRFAGLGVAAVAALLVQTIGAAQARADACMYLQGRGVAGADNAGELSPGAMQPAHGTGLGVRLGARFLFLDAFAGRTDFGAGAIADRAVVNAAGDFELGNMRLRGAAGVGAMRLRDGALGFDDVGRADGPLARAALALDVSIGAGFWLGAEIETTVFRLLPESGSILRDSRAGAAVLASLQLSFELGL